ncbi:ABC transporter permease [Caballeronia sp. LjRoot31]|uniref:ABC transporter permease n=1 Tax=Caballeronia sp. LjRoot31 TaxID=3342324 RepID=UPI003ECECDE1
MPDRSSATAALPASEQFASDTAASQSKEPARAAAFSRVRAHTVRIFERSVALVAFLLLWEFLPRAGIVNSAYLSPPSAVLVAIAHLFESGEVWKHLGSSAFRSIAGLLLAVTAGIIGGFLLGWFRRAERIADPLYQLLRQVSAFALFPVFMLFLGIGESSKIAIIVWAAFWPVLLNTLSGVKQVERIFIDCARSMGAKQGFIFAKVILPAALPQILTGIRLAGAYSITALVAAEMIGARSGLGFYTLNSQETFQIPDMYAGIVLLALFGLLINYGLSLLERKLLRWRVGIAQNG